MFTFHDVLFCLALETAVLVLKAFEVYVVSPLIEKRASYDETIQRHVFTTLFTDVFVFIISGVFVVSSLATEAFLAKAGAFSLAIMAMAASGVLFILVYQFLRKKSPTQNSNYQTRRARA